MATNPRVKIGTMPCEGQRCESHAMGRRVTVYRSQKSGTLGYHCDICDRSPYAKQGTGQHDEWMGDIVPIPEKAASAPPDEVQQPAIPEAVPAKKAGFSLGGLR